MSLTGETAYIGLDGADLVSELFTGVPENTDFLISAYEILMGFSRRSTRPNGNTFAAIESVLTDLHTLVEKTSLTCTDSIRKADFCEAAALLAVFALTPLRNWHNRNAGALMQRLMEDAFIGSSYNQAPLQQYQQQQHQTSEIIKVLMFAGLHERAALMLTETEILPIHVSYLVYLLQNYPIDQKNYNFMQWRTAVLAWRELIKAERDTKSNEMWRFYAIASPELGDNISYCMYFAKELRFHSSVHFTRPESSEELDSQYSELIDLLDILLGENVEAPTWWAKFGALYFYNSPYEDAIKYCYTEAALAFPDSIQSTWDLGSQALLEDCIVTAIDHLRQLNIACAAVVATACLRYGCLDGYGNLGSPMQEGTLVVHQLLLQFASQCLAQATSTAKNSKRLSCIGFKLYYHLRKSPLVNDWAVRILPKVVRANAALAVGAAEMSKVLGLPQLRRDVLLLGGQQYMSLGMHSKALELFCLAKSYHLANGLLWTIFDHACTGSDTLTRATNEFLAMPTTSPFMHIIKKVSRLLLELVEQAFGGNATRVLKCLKTLMHFPQPDVESVFMLVRFITKRGNPLLTQKIVSLLLEMISSLKNDLDQEKIANELRRDLLKALALSMPI